VAQRRQVRDLPVEIGGEEHERPDDRVDERLGKEARRDGRVGGARHRPVRQVDLDDVAAAGGQDRVRADARQVGGQDAAPAHAPLGVGGLEDRPPGGRPQHEVRHVERDGDHQDTPVDLCEVVPEGDRRVPEGLE
jgi:hypothetical protein